MARDKTAAPQEPESNRRFLYFVCGVFAVVAILLAYSVPELSHHARLASPLHRKLSRALATRAQEAVLTKTCNSAAIGFHAVMDVIVNGTLLLSSLEARVHGQLGLGDGVVDSDDELSMVFSTFFESSVSTETGAKPEYLANLTNYVRGLPGTRVATGGYGGVAASEMAKVCKSVFLAASPGDELVSTLPRSVKFPQDATKQNEYNVVMDSYHGEKWGWLNFSHATSGTLRLRPRDSHPLDAVPSWAMEVEKSPPNILYLSGLQLLGSTSLNRDERNIFYEKLCDVVDGVPIATVTHLTLASSPTEKTFLDISETVGEVVESLALSFTAIMDWVNIQQTHQVQPSADRKARKVDYAAAGARTLFETMRDIGPDRIRNLTRIHVMSDAFQLLCHQVGSRFINTRTASMVAAQLATELSCGEDLEQARFPFEEARRPIEKEQLNNRVPDFRYEDPATCYDDGSLHCCVTPQFSCPFRPVRSALNDEKVAVKTLLASLR